MEFAALEALHGGDGKALDGVGEGEKGERKEAHEAVYGGGNGIDIVELVEVEQAFADDAEGELEHVGVEVAGGAGLPGGGHAGGGVRDDDAVAGDAVAMEGGLGEAALAHVEGFLAGEEAVAEDGAGTLHDEVAMVVGAVGDEEVADEVGVVELVDVAAEGAVVDEIAEAPGGVEHEVGGGGLEGLAGEDARQEGGAGGIAGVAAGADVGRREGHEVSVDGDAGGRLAPMNSTLVRRKWLRLLCSPVRFVHRTQAER